jgi:hypothetical protein
MEITTGFLTGNLWDGIDPDAYAAALTKHLETVYPDARVRVMYQRGEGSVPFPLRTAVYAGDDENFDEDARTGEIEFVISAFDNRVVNESALWDSLTNA